MCQRICCNDTAAECMKTFNVAESSFPKALKCRHHCVTSSRLIKYLSKSVCVLWSSLFKVHLTIRTMQPLNLAGKTLHNLNLVFVSQWGICFLLLQDSIASTTRSTTPFLDKRSHWCTDRTKYIYHLQKINNNNNNNWKLVMTLVLHHLPLTR